MPEGDSGTGRPSLITLPTPNLCACECKKNHSVEQPICTFVGQVGAHFDSILLMCRPCYAAIHDGGSGS